ncbi:single-stranded DNA-binding protein (plasmid) [Pontibacillus sp. ALD_SL1]|uniref:single-stranded DNA-binding protein n=1 Tax=Pontibacillus sp. ALD_SL1 TaxID=2777185 RepID=UPI001A964899|nr:single-stranded DNA-binding protein [Pontibacillus sp. ALD_SL1]QST02985.1 single-stranded DNA-binding protein [Pontibacillus sp. ALD_SL1]
MKEIEYKRDENFVDITGTIQNLPDYCKYIPRPLIAFDLVSYRKRKSEEDEWKTDENRIVLFDEETFHEEYENGDRIRVKGELQSRNYTRDNHEVENLIVMAVQNYIEIREEVPALKQPTGRKRQPIDWSKLLDIGFIPSVPEDSMYKEDGRKEKTQESPYVYRVDANGDVFKETEHVAYEVIAKSIERLDEEKDPLYGDRNKVVLCGKVMRSPYYDYLGQENKVAFLSFNLKTKSSFFEDRVFYNNIIAWGDLAVTSFESMAKHDIVRVSGRLQSREYNKTVTKRWVTEHNNKKKKKIDLTLMTREVSASKIEKCIIHKK